NFEAPADADGDNAYEINVVANDGTTTTNKAVTITLTDQNDTPVVTSADSPNAAENAAAATVVYTATSTDEDGDTVTYSLTGADAALFTINRSTGEVTLHTSPNLEAPADADGDNAYEINVVADDGTTTTNKAV